MYIYKTDTEENAITFVTTMLQAVKDNANKISDPQKQDQFRACEHKKIIEAIGNSAYIKNIPEQQRREALYQVLKQAVRHVYPQPEYTTVTTMVRTIHVVATRGQAIDFVAQMLRDIKLGSPVHRGDEGAFAFDANEQNKLLGCLSRTQYIQSLPASSRLLEIIDIYGIAHAAIIDDSTVSTPTTASAAPRAGS